RTVTNSDGTTSEESYSYTVHYTVTVEYTYEVEVKYTEEIEVTETIAVEVPDEDDAEKKKAAEEAAQKAWEDEIARMKQEEFEKKLQEVNVQPQVKASTEAQKTEEAQKAKEAEIQEMSDEQFQTEKDKGNIVINKVEINEITDSHGNSIVDETSLANLNKAINNGSATIDQAMQDLGAAASIKNAIDNSTVSVNTNGQVQVNVPTPGKDNQITTVNVVDIEDPSAFVQGYNNAVTTAGSIPGSSSNYNTAAGWQITVPTPGSTAIPPQTTTVNVNNMSDTDMTKFVQGYNNAVSMTGSIPGSTSSYSATAGWQVSVSIPGSTTTPPQTATVNVNGMSNRDVTNFISDYNDAKKIADETGLATNYSQDNGWQIIYNNGTEDKTINLSDFNDVDIFIKNYKKAADIASETGMGINFNNENNTWQVTYNNGTEEKAINVSSIDDNNVESFIENYNKAKEISSGTDMNINYSGEQWYVTYNDGKDSIKVSGIEDMQTFIQEYNDAERIAKETGSGFTLNYSNDKGWGIKYYDGQRGQNVNIDVSDIQDIDKFIDDYNKIVKADVNGNGKFSYDTETGTWTIKAGKDTVSADQINVSDDGTVLITMDDGVVINASYLDMYTDLKKYAEDNNYVLSFTEEAGKLIIKDSEGQILFDASVPVTYTDGDPVGLAGENTTTGTEISDVSSTITIGDLSLADIKGYVSLKVAGASNEALTNYLISRNGFTERTVTDSDGNILYVDKPVVETVGSGRTGVFERTYADGVTKLIIEGYSNDYSGVTTQQTFAQGTKNDKPQKIVMADGTVFYSDFNLVLERVSGYTYNDDGSVTESFALFDADGDPYYVQTGTYGADGKYTRSTEELSMYIPKNALGEQDGSGGSGGSNPLQVYLDLLSDIGSQRVRTVDGKSYQGYDGFKYFNSGMINLDMCVRYDGQTGTIPVTIKVDGKDTTINVIIPNFEFSDGFSTEGAYYELGSNTDFVRGQFNEEITFSTTEGIQLPEGYQYFGDTATNSYHTQQPDEDGVQHETVIDNVKVDLETGQVSYTSGVSTVVQGGVTALLGGADAGTFIELANIVKGVVTAVVDAVTGIANWISGVVADSWSYGVGLLSTSVGIVFDYATGLFAVDSEQVAEAIQAQKDRLATMADVNTSEADKQTALQEFYDNLPLRYKNYLDSLGVTPDQITITEDGLLIRQVVDPASVNIPQELNGCQLTGDTTGQKFDLLFAFDGNVFVRTTDIFALTSGRSIDTNLKGYIDIGIEISQSGVVNETGIINFHATNTDAYYKDTNMENSEPQATTEDTSGDARTIYTHGKVIQSEDGTIISSDADGKLVLTFLKSQDGYQAAFMGVGAEFTEGSYLEGIGEVTSGTLKIIGQTSAGYQFASADGTCVVKQTGVENIYGALVDITTTYNVYGIQQMITSNSKTGAVLTTNYTWANGQLTGVSSELKAVKAGDTGLGYIVDDMNGYSNVILNIDAEGIVRVSNGAVVSQILGQNENGDMIYAKYIGHGWAASVAAADVSYQLIQDGTVTQLTLAVTTDVNKLYAVQNGILTEVILNNNGTFSVTKHEGVEGQYNEETGATTYTIFDSGNTSRQNIIITLASDGTISSTMDLLEVNINGVWYEEGNSVQIPGMEGSYTVGETEQDGIRRWMITPEITDDWQGPTVQISLSDGNVTDAVLTKPLLLGFNNGQIYFELQSDNAFEYNGVSVSIAQGAVLMLSDKNELVIIDGLLKVSDKAIEIPAATETAVDANLNEDKTGEETSVPDASGTNIQISENKDADGKLLSYTVSNGTIQITNGALVIMGLGATFKTNSVINGQTIKSGSLTIAAFDDEGRPVFIAVNGYARTDMGGVTVTYNQSGVSAVYQSVSLAGKDVEGVDDAKWNAGSYYKTTFATEAIIINGQASQYRTFATDSNGNLKVASHGYYNASYTQQVTENITALVNVSFSGVATVVSYSLTNTAIKVGGWFSGLFKAIGSLFKEIVLKVKYNAALNRLSSNPLDTAARQEMVEIGAQLQANEEAKIEAILMMSGGISTDASLFDNYNLYGLYSQGVTFNGTNIEQYDFATGNLVTITTTDIEQAKQIMIRAGSYAAGLSLIKANGLYTSEIALDKSGQTIYTGTNVGQSLTDGSGFVAIEYDYAQDYQGGIYTDQAKAGSSVLVVDGFNNYLPTTSMVYNLQPSGTAQTTAQNLSLNGVTLTYTGTISSVSKVLEWSGYNTAKSVNFADGKPISFDEITVGNDNKIQKVESIDLKFAYSEAELPVSQVEDDSSSTDDGATSENVLSQYMNVLANADALKFSGQDGLYGVFDKVSSSHIDMSKAVYNNAQRNLETGALESLGLTYNSVLDGMPVLVEVGVDGLEETSNWRDWTLKTGDESVAKVSYTDTDGKTYENIYTTTNIQFSDSKSFAFTADFTDASKNTLILNRGDLSKGTYTSIEYTNAEITMNGGNLVYNQRYIANPNANSTVLNTNSDIFFREYVEGKVVGGYDSYSANSTVYASLLPREYMDTEELEKTGADTFTLAERTKFEWTIGEDGYLAANGPVNVQGTYNHTNPDGTKVTGEIFTLNDDGTRTEGAVFEVGSNGEYALKGEVETKTNTWTTSTGGEPGEPSDTVVTVNTNGLITETDSSVSITNGIVSIRGGALTIIGEGAVATDGSVLNSAGGFVTTSGEYKYSGGAWGPLGEASFTFNDPDNAADRLEESFAGAGLDVSGLDDLDFSVQMTGYISTDPMMMVETVLRNQDAEQYDATTTNINATVTDHEYTLSNNIILEEDAQFNISLQSLENGEQVLAFKANNTFKADTGDGFIPEGWTTNNGSSFNNIEFSNGEYITLEVLLAKAGVTTVTGEGIKWEIGTEEEYNLGLSVVSGDYKVFGSTYLSLTGTENFEFEGQQYSKTELTGEYEGQKFTILSGAKVSISANGISIINANVYTENMNVSKQNTPSDEQEDSQQGSGSATDLISYFEGNLTKNSDGDLLTTGIFHNYSDVTAAQVFSEATVYNVGSILRAQGDTEILGLGTNVSGRVKIEGINEDGTRKFVAVDGTVTFTNALGQQFELNTTGTISHIMQESDIIYDRDTQELVKVGDTYYIVNKSDGKTENGNGGWSITNWDLANDTQASNGMWYENNALQEVVELTDPATGNGIGIFVSIYEGDMKHEGETVGTSKDDDIVVLRRDGTKMVLDVDGTWFKGGLDDINIGESLSSSSIDSQYLADISLRDLASGTNAENVKQVMLNGYSVYINEDALGNNYVETYTDPNSGMHVTITHGTRSEERKAQGYTYNVTVNNVDITYVGEDGNTYTFSGNPNNNNEYKLLAEDGTYINFDLTGNSYTAETVAQGEHNWQKVTTSYVSYTQNADGSGTKSVYTDFIGETIEEVVGGTNNQHSSTMITTNWDEYGRTTYIDNQISTWTGIWEKDMGRPTSVTVEQGSYRATYAYSSDTSRTPIPTSRVDYYGTMSDIKYDKNQIKSFSLGTGDSLTEITTLYNAQGEPTSIKKEIISGYTDEDRTDLEALKAKGLTAEVIDDILNGGEARISYQYVDGVKYVQEISNIKRETYTGVVGQDNPFSGVLNPNNTEYIISFKQNTVKTTTAQEQGSTSYKTITTTVSEQDIITIYSPGDQTREFAVRSNLLSSEINSVLYDSQNRIVYETQKGGVYQVTALTNLSNVLNDTNYQLSDKTTTIDLSEFVGTGVSVGQVLSLGKTDIIKSYTYHDNGDVETNSYTYNYNFLDQSALYGNDERFKDIDTSKGTVEIILEHSIGKTLIETTTESFVYALNAGTGEASEDASTKYNSRTINYSAGELEHKYSYDITTSLGAYNIIISKDATIKDMLAEIEKFGDAALSERAAKMTQEQLQRLLSGDSYTFYGVNADLINGTIAVDINMSTTAEYDAQGNVKSVFKDGGKNGGHYVYALADTDFVQSTDLSSLSLNFYASGIFSSKSIVDKSGKDLMAQAGDINSKIQQDMSAGTNNILGEINTAQSYLSRRDFNFMYDTLGRVVASENEVILLNGETMQGVDIVKYTSSENGVTIAETYSFTVNEEGKLGYYNNDGNFVAEVKPNESALTSTSGYGYGNIGYNRALDFNSVVVNQYNNTSDARDAQRLSRYETRNAIVTGIVTALYVVASVALAIVTFGTSALIQLTVTAAITAALALAAIPAVYKGMKAGMEAATVGDTQKAVTEFVFVALSFAMVFGAFAKGLAIAAQTGAKVSKLSMALGKTINAASSAFKASKVGQVLGSVGKFINPMSTLSERLSLFGGKSWAFTKWLTTSGVGKLFNLGLSIGGNALVYGINIGPVKLKGALPWILDKAGLSELTNSTLFKSVMTILTFAPVFNSKVWGNAKNAVKSTTGQIDDVIKVAGGNLDDVARSQIDDIIKASGGNLDDIARSQIDDIIKASGGTFDDVARSQIDDIIQKAVNQQKPFFTRVKDLWKEVKRPLVKEGQKRSLPTVVSNWGKNFADDFVAQWSQLKSQLGANFSLRKTIGGKVFQGFDNFAGMFVSNSTRMISSITKFNIVVINGAFGAVNTILDSMGVSYNGQIPLPIPNMFGWFRGLVSGDWTGVSFFLKVQAPVYKTGGDFIMSSLESTSTTVSSPSMWIFSAVTPFTSTLIGPIFNNMPLIGRLARFANGMEGIVGGKSDMARTFFSENIKEEFFGGFVDILLPGLPQGMREMLKECFDDTPDMNTSMLQYNTQTYTQIQQQTIDLATLQGEQRIERVAEIMNIINSRAGNATQLTSADIVANRGQYRTLLTSTDSGAIQRAVAVEIAASKVNGISSAQKHQLERVVNSDTATGRSSYVQDLTVPMLATYLTNSSGVIFGTKGQTDVIQPRTTTETLTRQEVSSTTDYINGLALIYQQQVKQKMPINTELINNIKTALGQLNGTYDVINAVGNLLSAG
ncbi:MAG: hypothetical protein PHR82_06570, partial [Endomicrobiaceae bacterium]|nr:hypothetical protein [Endomicrobiaceae bacterium]